VVFSCACHLASFAPGCVMQCMSSVRYFHERGGTASYVTAEGYSRACVEDPALVMTKEGLEN
jgi:hypothetical protein